MGGLDCLASFIYTQVDAKALEKEIADVKETCFVQWNASSLREIDGNFLVVLTITLACSLTHAIIFPGSQRIVPAGYLIFLISCRCKKKSFHSLYDKKA